MEGYTAEELDLTADLLPIAEYVEDRSEMVAQMLASLRIPVIKSMLPAALRSTSLDSIRDVLLHELSSIPKKDVLDVLSDGSSYIPFAEAIRQMEQDVEKEIEEKAPSSKPTPKIDRKPARTAREERAEPMLAEDLYEGLPSATEPSKSEEQQELSPEELVEKLLAEEIGSRVISEEEAGELRARLLRKLTSKKDEENSDVALPPSALPENIDIYDDTARFGDGDEQASKPFMEDDDEDSVPDGFERRNIEGKVFRSRLGDEGEEQLHEPEMSNVQSDMDVDEEEIPDRPLSSVSIGAEKERKKSKKKHKKHRRHKKRAHRDHRSSEDGELQETAVVVPENQPQKLREEPLGSEEGELETDEEIETLVESKRRQEEERQKKLKQLEILKRIAPDEYYMRFREFQMEEGNYPEVEDRKSASSSEEDECMPWNDPNYGSAKRVVVKKEPRVDRPTNPIEVTNPVPDHPIYQVGLPAPKRENGYVEAVESSLRRFEADLASYNTDSSVVGLSDLASVLAGVQTMLDNARNRMDDPGSGNSLELDALEERIKSHSSSLAHLRSSSSVAIKSVKQEEEEEGEVGEEEEEGEVDD